MDPLSLPQLNRLVEASFVRDKRSASNDDVPVIPSQLKVTHQILSHQTCYRSVSGLTSTGEVAHRYRL